MRYLRDAEHHANKADRRKSRARNSLSHCMSLKRKKVKCDRQTDRRTDRPTDRPTQRLIMTATHIQRNQF